MYIAELQFTGKSRSQHRPGIVQTRRQNIMHFFHSKYMQLFMISQNLNRKNAFF